MLRRRLRQLIDEEAVKAAISAAEHHTTGEIRVSVSTFFWGDVRKAAERAFERLGMTATVRRNGVLFFLVPSRRKFVVLGDEGIHQVVGQGFWDGVSAAISDRFRKGD
ncbi:MAG TPA: TPM domain-containing protein, partial [Thermoanaerobaculia bacterium]|nr:TPM domain-containing protein [Thermoanaerobaculia bacterium]